MALGPKTENSVSDGDGNTLIGHNAGTVSVGLTFEQHEAALEKAVEEKAADLERAHGAERATLQTQLDALNEKIANKEVDYAARLEELERTKQLLTRYENQIDRDKRAAAFNALDKGETRLAEALLKELSASARARSKDAAIEEAELEYELGKLAETEIRWHDAYDHYKRAAGLSDDETHLVAYARMTWRLHKTEEGLVVHERLAEAAKQAHGAQSAEYATQINNLAGVVEAQGRYEEAEALNREALEIDRATIGERHPSYATHLNNLAGVVQAQGRLEEAVTLFREALEIDRATIGERHPDYATRLNNLALVVEAQGRFEEAEALYREALEIDRATIGERHPDYAMRLNNLASVVEAQGRFEEAEGLYREALEIDRATIGERHPDYAIDLNNLAGVVRAQGRLEEAETLYREALEIFEAALSGDHPSVTVTRDNLASLLSEKD